MIVSLILLGTLATLTTAGYFVLRPRPTPEVVFHYFRCPACDQKLRCAADKVEQPGMCPRCKNRWGTPPLSAAALANKRRRQPVGRRLDLRRAG
jgi:hypothetical protein